ncbi:hypothetical protein RB614_26940 [Phytohabitans sp. ZYX-F-186]|uniref:Uncharacterized protein n=1 Tax=Phytohabitans maris TaxID=3071409 RepID=A0ABU0ZQH8_9ACTN|nr:hypothetical protein [Phytohabitans sp. ZYX-F-186]MDQ7908167.1 hypothetical protein [Phytohabitans sp. ZYX-F-186]
MPDSRHRPQWYRGALERGGMDRAGLPPRTGPDSVELVIAETGGPGLRGELGVGLAIASVAAPA